MDQHDKDTIITLALPQQCDNHEICYNTLIGLFELGFVFGADTKTLIFNKKLYQIIKINAETVSLDGYELKIKDKLAEARKFGQENNHKDAMAILMTINAFVAILPKFLDDIGHGNVAN